MFDLDWELRRSRFPLRIRKRSEENETNDVWAGRAFVARERFGSRANSANARDSRLFAEFRLARIQPQHATNSGRESPRQKAFVASTAEQLERANPLAKE